MGRQFSLYLRYFLPLYPALAVLAGYLLVEVVAWFARPGERRVPVVLAGRALVAALLLGAVLPGLAYLSIYSRPVTRIEASAWLLENLPAGSFVATEHWDDALPLLLPGSPEKRFENIDLPLYELDTAEKVRTLIERLDRADFVVLSSNRLLESIPRNGVNYPVTTRYYDQLFSGALGFELAKEFSSPPSLLGVDFPDNQVEESWSSYDHPRVLIFQKTAAYSHERSERLLGRGPFATFGLSPAQADRNGLLLSPEDLRTQQQGGTWTDVFKSTGLANTNPTLLWLLAVQAASFAALPLTLTLFRRLPDRGYLLSKPLGLLLAGYIAWLIVSLKLVTFEQATVVGVLAGLAVISLAITAMRRREVGGFFAQNWRLVLLCELLFLAAFFFCREIRMLNPDLWHPFRGGEKPMDLAYFTAITRSTTLPPYDPWLAGGYINYYYLGQFFAAVFTKLTAIPPEIAYNLAVPTFFAATVAGAFSVAYNLAAVARRHLRRAPGFRPLPPWSLYGAGLLGVFLVTLAGNLDGFGQLSDRLSAVSSYEFESGIPVVDSLVNSAGGLWQVLVHGARLEAFDFWRPSRMMPPQISITEFPQFSFLFADLHAHMIAIPFEVLAVAIALGLALRPGDERNGIREWGLLFLMALTVGGLRWINSWDYPTFMLAGLAAIAIGERRLEGGTGPAFLRGGAKAAVMVALSFLLYKPFADNYATPVSGLQDAVDVTPPHQFAAHFGVFLFILGVWLVFYVARAWKSSPMAVLPSLFKVGPSGAEAARRFEAKQAWLAFALGVAGVTLILGLGLYVQGKELVAMLLPALVVILALAGREVRLRRPDGGLRLFVLMLAALGLGLAAGVDLITIKGDIERMNTVFKFYLHAWVVLALAASFAGWYLFAVAWRPRQESGFCRAAPRRFDLPDCGDPGASR
jgi:YYY domain-containing protein